MALTNLNDIVGREAEATDGPIGKVFDFFFDDEAWKVRYIVIDTGTWITSHKILLAIESLEPFDGSDTAIRVKHPRGVIEKSPKIDLAKPVSHWEENMVRRHYGAWPHWAPYHVGAGPHKLSNLRDKAAEDLDERENIPTYSLHSTREPSGLHVRLRDDVVEKLVDFAVDPATWDIRQFIIRAGVAGSGPLSAVDREHVVEFDREVREIKMDIAAEETTAVGEESRAK